VAAYDQSSIGVVAGSLAKTWHLSGSEVGLLTSVALAGMILGGAVAGLLADRFGRRGLLLADLALFVGAAAATALAPSYWWLVALRFLVGVGIGSDYTISLVYLAEAAPCLRRGRWLAATLWGANIGTLAAYGAGAFLASSANGWRWVLGLGAIGALLALLGRRGIPETEHFQSVTPKTLIDNLRESLARRSLASRWRAMAAWFSYQVSDQGLSLLLPLILVAVLSESVANSSASALLVKAITIPVSLATVFVIDRWGRRRLQVGGFLLRGLALALLAFVLAFTDHPSPLLIGLLFVVAIAVGSAGPDKTTAIFPAESAGHHNRATGQGMSQAAGRFGGIAGLVGYSVLSGSLGPWAGIAWFALFCFIGGVVSLKMTDRTGQELQAEPNCECACELFTDS
jgi:MFS family permease